MHGDNCDCCEVCVENNNLFLDEQERILRVQPSSQPAGYDPSEFLSPPVIPNPSLNAPAEIQTTNVNTLVQTPVIAPVLAYDTPCKESDYVYDSETTITDSAYGRGYEAESENDNSSYSHNQEFVEVGNIDVVQLPEPEPPLIQSPHYNILKNGIITFQLVIVTFVGLVSRLPLTTTLPSKNVLLKRR